MHFIDIFLRVSGVFISPRRTRRDAEERRKVAGGPCSKWRDPEFCYALAFWLLTTCRALAARWDSAPYLIAVVISFWTEEGSSPSVSGCRF